MQSSPNRSESASTTTRPRPCSAATISGRVRRPRRVAWVRASTRGAVARRDRRGPVQAGRADAARADRRSRPRAPGQQLGQDPARRAAAVLVVLDGVVLQVQAEARQQLVEVVAVLLLLGLAEHDQPAAAARRTPRSRRAPRRSAAATRCRSSAPTSDPTDARSRARRSRAAFRASSGSSTFGRDARNRARPAPRRRGRRTHRPGWAGCIARASSGRIVHASLWASSNMTRASVPDAVMPFRLPRASGGCRCRNRCNLCNKSPHG